MINNLLFTLAKISKNPETAKRFRDLLCIQLCTQYLEGNFITLSTFIKEFNSFEAKRVSFRVLEHSFLRAATRLGSSAEPSQQVCSLQSAGLLSLVATPFSHTTINLLVVQLQKRQTPVIIYCCLKFHLELSLLKSKGAKPGVQSPSETNASFSSVPGTALGMMR